MNKKLLTVLFVVVVVLAVAAIGFVGCGKNDVKLSNISVSYNGENLDFGTQLNLSDLQVKALFSDNSEQVLNASDFEISGFNPNQLGVQHVTVSYQGFTATFDVEIIKTLQSISAEYKGAQLYAGQDLDKNDIEVKAHYSDSSAEIVSANSFEVSGFDSSVAGDQDLVISALNLTCALTVNVEAVAVESIEAIYNGDDLYTGDELDPADFTVAAEFNDGSREASVQGFTIDGFDSDVAGLQTLTISFGGQSCELEINVIALELESISAEYDGDELFVGDNLFKASAFDPDDIVVTAHYNKGDVPVADFDVELPETFGEEPGDYTLVISALGEECPLIISWNAIEVESISVEFIDEEKVLRETDVFDLSNLVVKGVFNNGKKASFYADEDEEDEGSYIFEGLTIDEYNFEEFGDYTVSFNFAYGQSDADFDLDLHVYGSVESITAEYIGGIKYVGGFVVGADFKVLATYNDGIEDELVKDTESYQIRGWSSDEAGEKVVTIYYVAGNGDARAEVTVNVNEINRDSKTLHDYMGAAPTNFNPHTWETNADSVIAGYAEMAFVDVTIAEDGVNFEWVLEMADSITDVTNLYAEESLGGKAIVPEGVTSGQVYRIALNQAAKWEDGTPINADTYVESMKRLLDPRMQNYRANTYYNGDTALKNAKAYFNAQAPIYQPCVPAYDSGEEPDYSFDIHTNKIFIKLAAGTTFAGDTYTISYLHTNYKAVNDTLYNKLAKAANAYGYIEVTAELYDDVIAALDSCCSLFGLTMYNADGSVNDEFLAEWCFYFTGNYSDPYDWENVGLKKIDDYTIDYILEDATSEFYFYTGMTGNWLVYTDLYDELKDTTGELVTTTYGTSTATYKSYGPYKLATFQKDRQLTFVRNENWYGWTDGKHEGQFQTTDIIIDVLANEATIENLFLAGQLDSLGLNSTQLAQYRTSEYLLKTDQTYTFRYIFATDKAALAALEEQYGAEDCNLKILSYKDFRKAMSLAIDRAALTAQATGGYKPSYSLFSSLYYYDIENDTESIYRNTDDAMQAIVDLYGVEYGPGSNYGSLEEAYLSITGLDIAQAKALFTQAYNEAVAAGDYTDGQKIIIHCMCSAAQELTEDDTMQQNLLTRFMAAATEGTPLEGKISFEFKCGSSTRYDDVAAGKVEMIRGAWGGAAFYPFSTIRVYTNPEYMGGLAKIHESCGWNPAEVSLELTYDFDGDGEDETVTLSLEDWSNTINGGVKNNDGSFKVPSYDDPDTKLFIMSKLEKAVLESYQCIPWATETACSLFSQKISYATLNYNIMYGYGGLRLMTYNYTDGEWADYVAAQGGRLQY